MLPLSIKIPKSLFADLWLTSNLASLGCHLNVTAMDSQRRRREVRDPSLPDHTPFSTHNGNGAQGCRSSALPGAETNAATGTTLMAWKAMSYKIILKLNLEWILHSLWGKKKTSKLKAKGGGGGGRLAGRRSPSVCGTQIWGLDVYKVWHQPPRKTPEQKCCASSPGPQVRFGPL